MENNYYIPRLMDSVLKENLELYGAVSLEGCKWCGKSTTARQLANSSIEMQNPTTAENNKAIAKSDPGILLSGDKPRLIDEWQDTPAIWDAIRYDVDKTGLTGQYILTGSSTPKVSKPAHSGAGRIVRLIMRPMSLYESGESNGAVSLKSLFCDNENIAGEAGLTPEDIARLCTRGGWPASVKRNPTNAGKLARDYLEIILTNESMTDLDNDISFSTPKMRAVIRSLARNIASPVTGQTIINDVIGTGETISDKTLSSYLETLNRLHILDDVEPWSPQLRSKTTIRSGWKRNFTDPSLVVAALLASENDLRLDYRTFGLVFESMALRDLKIYAESLDGRLYYYRDKAGRECDAIIHLPDGKWGAIEIKLGSDETSISEGSRSLRRFVDSVDTEVMRQPSFLMILTATTNYAYRQDDGIYIVPIGCLKN